MYPRPAHQTKDISPLSYPLTPYKTVQIVQKAPLDSISTGTTLYLSSQLLAHYLQETLPRGTNAIEVGAGTGLVSIALSQLGWKVYATDLLNVIEDVLSPNVSQNGGNIVVRELDWCKNNSEWNDSKGFNFDLIVCADGIYSMELLEPLINTLKMLSGTSSPLIVMAFERRDGLVIENFFESASRIGFKCKKANLRRILGRQIQRWGWTDDDWHSAEVWTMRFKGQ